MTLGPDRWEVGGHVTCSPLGLYCFEGTLLGLG